MVGRVCLLVVNITVGDSGRATWVHHCIRTSAMTRCVFRRIIFFHELGRPFFLLLRFLPFFLSLFRFFFFFFWNATAYFAQFAIRGYAPADRIVDRSFKVKAQLINLKFCRLIFPVRDVCRRGNFRVQSPRRISSGRRIEANRHAHGGFALSVHKEGQPDVTVQIGKEEAELLVVFIQERGFQLRIRQRRDR